MTTDTQSWPLPHGDAEYVTEVARGIATGQLLVADLHDRSWQASLALMMNRLAVIPNLGAILVPMAPHAHLSWINNTAPGITMQCQLVAQQDLEAVNAEVARMHQALHPQPNKENTTMKVNNMYAEPGLIVDGDVHGIYAEDKLADIAIAFGFELDDNHDPRHWRARIAESEETGDGMEDNHREALDESTTKLIEMMNAASEGCRFEWEDGDVFLIEEPTEEA